VSDDKSRTTSTLIDEYIALFRKANPNTSAPTLTYEDGWFVFRYAATGLTPDRVRRAELVRLADRLRERVNA
jgi:hypothetical protein